MVSVPRLGARARAISDRAPSFGGLVPASAASSLAKRMNRSTNTRHERLIRSLLWKRGLRYRKNVKALPGKPDIVFAGERVAVFCDGDFWHGRDWTRLARKLRTCSNGAYWLQKIRSNRSRDRRNTRLLEKNGWTVIRVWETDIHTKPEEMASAIEQLVLRRRRS